MKELWRDVVDWEGIYLISSYGRIKRNGVIKAIKLPAKNGYYYATLDAKPKKRRYVQIHVLVATAFLGIRPPNYIVDHRDRNPLNNAVENLRYLSHSENHRNSLIWERASGVETHIDSQRPKPYGVRFSVEGRRRFFGWFSTYDEAFKRAAIERAKLRLD